MPIYIGLTKESRDTGRDRLRKLLKIAGVAFFFACLAPLLIGTLFRFSILHSTPVFSPDIQQPVAKVMTTQATGTAFLVSPTKLLTARHVLDGSKEGDKVQLLFDRTPDAKMVTATVLYIAPQGHGQVPTGSKVTLDYFLDDVAVLEVPAITDIPPLELGASDAVSVLDEVILIGYPQGDYSITKGNINSDKYEDLDLFKLDAAANPGNSGGPCLLREDHTVIGILVGGGGAGTQGQNVAVKINQVKDLLKKKGIDLVK